MSQRDLQKRLDLFTAAALQGILANPNTNPHSGDYRSIVATAARIGAEMDRRAETLVADSCGDPDAEYRDSMWPGRS